MVLLRQRKKNKFSTKYDIRPFKVIGRKGTAVILERNGSKIMRNVSLVKKIPVGDKYQNSTSLGHSQKDNNEDEEDSDLDFDVSIHIPRPIFPRMQTRRYPSRTRRPPRGLNEYVR